MSTGKTTIISAAVSLALICIGRVSVALDIDFSSLLLAPGGIVDIFRMRSVHGGFRDLASEVTISGVSFVFWFLVIFIFTRGYQILVRPKMKKAPNQPPQTMTGSSAPDRV